MWTKSTPIYYQFRGRLQYLSVDETWCDFFLMGFPQFFFHGSTFQSELASALRLLRALNRNLVPPIWPPHFPGMTIPPIPRDFGHQCEEFLRFCISWMGRFSIRLVWPLFARESSLLFSDFFRLKTDSRTDSCGFLP